MLSSLKKTFLGIGATSALVNILALTGSFFMLQVYDRVIPGRSLPTLVGLGIIAATLYAFQGILELVRSMLLVRVGHSVDERFGETVYDSLVLFPSRMQVPGDGLQSVRDLDFARGFLSGPGPTALFDIPWMPFYLGLCFLFHVWIGVTASGRRLDACWANDPGRTEVAWAGEGGSEDRVGTDGSCGSNTAKLRSRSCDGFRPSAW